MSFILDDLKKSDETRGPHRPPRLGAVHSPERKESKRGAHRHLLAFALVFGVCLLLWLLGPLRSSQVANPEGQPASRAQALQAARTEGGSLSAPSPGRADGQGRQNPEGKKEAQVEPNAAVHASIALGNGNPASHPPDIPVEPPSFQRARSMLETSSDPVPGLPPLEEAGGVPTRARKSHSAARSIAIADATERFPAAYYARGSRAQSTPTAKMPDSPNWPEPSGAEKPAATPAKPQPAGAGGKGSDAVSEASAGKAAVSEEVLEFYKVPFQVRDPMPMSISMLAYSNRPDERWANVNGLRMHEGEQTSSGVTVEEISRDGVVFNYQGHRYYKAVRED